MTQSHEQISNISILKLNSFVIFWGEGDGYVTWHLIAVTGFPQKGNLCFHGLGRVVCGHSSAATVPGLTRRGKWELLLPLQGRRDLRLYLETKPRAFKTRQSFLPTSVGRELMPWSVMYRKTVNSSIWDSVNSVLCKLTFNDTER